MQRLGRYLITLTLAALVTGCLGDAPETPPNVVVILIDDLGWVDTGVYGSVFYETPNIDRLAAEGMRFTQFYTASSVCSLRSRASASGETSLVIALDAPTIAPSPIETGATSTQLEPIEAPAPTRVRCLAKPS